MLDGVEPQITKELRHSAERAEGVMKLQALRARWLGHRLRAEMTLAVDPALSLADARKVANTVTEHASHHLPALDNLHVEVVPASSPKRSKQRPHPESQHGH
jgi:divalent metal cation (Fe/Co/Zn/Cd) transporter